MLPVDAYMRGPHEWVEEHARRVYADFDTQFEESDEDAIMLENQQYGIREVDLWELNGLIK